MKKPLVVLLTTLLLALFGCTIPPQEEIFVKNYTVVPYVTTGTKTKLLLEEEAFLLGPVDEENPLGYSVSTISIDSRVLFQEMDGFGAAMTESSAYVISGLSPEVQEEMMNDLFSRDGIAMSFVIIPMGASDFSLDNFSYNDLPFGQTDVNMDNFSLARDEQYIIPVLQVAKTLNPHLLLMGSPWSAPAWMKTSDNLNGGSLKPEYYQAYSKYFTKFIQGYTEAGLPIYAITMQNEPLHETTSYPSMKMTATEQINFVKELGLMFQNNQIDTKIIAYDHNWDNTAYAMTVIGNPLVKGYVAGSAFHCYAGDNSAQATVQKFYPNKGLWFTECSGGRWGTDFSNNLSWNMENVFLGSINNYSKGVMLWNIALNEQDGPKNGGCQNCRGVITVKDDGTYQKNEEYYVIGHFSKFLYPGAFRIETKVNGNESNISASSFLNENGEIVVVLHNKSSGVLSITLNVMGSKNIYRIPSKSIVTLVVSERE